MSRRSRIIGFGSAALLVVVGGICVALLPGLASDIALGVLGVGIVVAVSLVFLEVGYSEDRDRVREEAARGREEEAQRGPRVSARPERRRLRRMRDHRRRLS